MTSAEQAAAAAAAKLLAPPSDEAPEVDPPVSSDDAVVDEVEDLPQVTAPNLDVELPEDLLEELDAPDEPEFAIEDDEEYEDEVDDFEVDPRIQKELARAKKEAAYYKNLRVQEAKKRWKDEAKKFFPLSENVLDQIEADSRRSFLRAAREAHETVKPFVARYVEQAEAERQAAIEQAKAEAKEEARRQWGIPQEGVNPTPPEDDPDDQAARISAARQRGDLAATIKEMVFPTRRS